MLSINYLSFHFSSIELIAICCVLIVDELFISQLNDWFHLVWRRIPKHYRNIHLEWNIYFQDFCYWIWGSPEIKCYRAHVQPTSFQLSKQTNAYEYSNVEMCSISAKDMQNICLQFEMCEMCCRFVGSIDWDNVRCNIHSCAGEYLTKFKHAW